MAPGTLGMHGGYGIAESLPPAQSLAAVRNIAHGREHTTPVHLARDLVHSSGPTEHNLGSR